MNLPRLSRALDVLVVDDDATNRLVASRMAELLGARVTVAAGGKEAVELCKARAFDVVLMDLRMPRVDGFAASRAIHALPAPADTLPIIAVSGDAENEANERCRAAGICAFVQKPISLRALADAIEVVIGEARPQKTDRAASA